MVSSFTSSTSAFIAKSKFLRPVFARAQDPTFSNNGHSATWVWGRRSPGGE